MDPANGFKSKTSFANQAQLKAAIRDVLNEPITDKRNRDAREDGEEFGPIRTADMMDSEDEDSELPKSAKKQKK